MEGRVPANERLPNPPPKPKKAVKSEPTVPLAKVLELLDAWIQHCSDGSDMRHADLVKLRKQVEAL